MGNDTTRRNQGFDRFNRFDRGKPHSRKLPGRMRRMLLGATSELTVVVATCNAEAKLEELLATLRDQDVPYEVEIMATDCGSTDRTLLILRSRGIRTLHIPQGKPSLSKVLLAAEGDVLVFLTQDTVPVRKDWLRELTGPLFEEETVGVTHGRIIADASVPPYLRGLAHARLYISGKQRIEFDGSRTRPGDKYLPLTNFAFSRKALQRIGDADLPASKLLERLFSNNFRKLYLPEAPVVLKGLRAVPDLLGDFWQAQQVPIRSLVSSLVLESAGLMKELYELSERSDLPSGERAEAYASAIALHVRRAVDLAGHRSALVKKVSSAIAKFIP